MGNKLSANMKLIDAAFKKGSENEVTNKHILFSAFAILFFLRCIIYP